jgi:hypothetical protein
MWWLDGSCAVVRNQECCYGQRGMDKLHADGESAGVGVGVGVGVGAGAECRSVRRRRRFGGIKCSFAVTSFRCRCFDNGGHLSEAARPWVAGSVRGSG